MSRIDLPSIYNPASQTHQELIDNFVVRTKLFEEIFKDIKNSDMKYPQQPYIIQGVRGQGKTTFLLRIAYEIERDKELSKQVIPVCFNEEQYNISRLFKLWETVAEYFEEQDELQGLYQSMQEIEFDEDYEIHCFELLENFLKKNNKKLILFIDNIDDILNKFTKKEQHRLREIFSESPEIRIIGASSVMLEFHYDYGHPFYQFFRMEQLKGLTSEETKILLLRLGEYYKRERVKEIVRNQLGRVEALRRLSSGVIRTIVLLFQIFVDDTDGNAFMDLEKILDQVTPLYKHRMEKLSPQHQEIVDVIGLNWDAVTAREIAEKTKMSSKAVSAQLKQLKKYHLIEKEKSSTKNYLYRIHERFFNIWYLMRRGRKWDEKRVRFLVEFLQIWCDSKTLEQRVLKHIESVKSGKLYDKHALFMTEALARTQIKRELQDQLIKETRSYLEKSESELKDYLSESDKELSEHAFNDYKTGNIDKAIEDIKKIKHKDKNDFFILGNLYRQSGKNFREAEEYYLKAVEKGHAGAMYNLALMFETEFKDFKQAEKYYRLAVEKGHAGAMYNLALMFKTEFKDFKQAEKYYRLAVEKGHAGAMYNLALMFQTEFKDFKQAEKFYRLAVEKGHAGAMNNLALLYKTEFKDFKQAEKFYRLAVEKGDAGAMNNLAWLFFQKKRNREKALEYARSSYKNTKSSITAHTYAIILLWNKDIEKAIEISNVFLNHKKFIEEYSRDINYFLMFLISQNQYHTALKIFHNNPHNLQDRFKPVYYALMYFLQDEYPNQYRKMGAELKETVDEIIKEIKQLAKEYK